MKNTDFELYSREQTVDIKISNMTKTIAFPMRPTDTSRKNIEYYEQQKRQNLRLSLYQRKHILHRLKQRTIPDLTNAKQKQLQAWKLC